MSRCDCCCRFSRWFLFLFIVDLLISRLLLRRLNSFRSFNFHQSFFLSFKFRRKSFIRIFLINLKMNNWKSISNSFQICNNWFHKNNFAILFNRIMFWTYSRIERWFSTFFIVYVRLAKFFMILIVDFLNSITKTISRLIKSSSKVNKRCSIDESKLIYHVKISFYKQRYKLFRINSTSWMTTKCLTRLIKMKTSR